MSDQNPLIEAARNYLQRGWYPVPVEQGLKGPEFKGWPKLRLKEEQLTTFFPSGYNIGLILGEASGGLVDIDLDCPEAIELASQFLPPTPAVTGRPAAPRSHWWYYADGVTTAQYRDPKINEMMLERRSTGVQTLVGPSIHPETGEQYEYLEAEPATVPGPMLEACVEALANKILEVRHGNLPEKNTTLPPPKDACPSDPDDFDIEKRVIAYLDATPPAISGCGGHVQTYKAAIAVVHGFGIEPERAFSLLWTHYNPRCEPPWTEKELRHKVEDAATKPHSKPYGHLRDEKKDEWDVNADVVTVKSSVFSTQETSWAEDPGLLPPELLRVPGFVSEVMDHCLETAPYPNPNLAFCGALALQAFLAGRKVRDQADNRPNIYLLGLAYSSVGKDWPRKINMRIARDVGLAGCIGDGFASGEGIQDTMAVRPTMLFQTDEIDGILQSINRAKDARHEGIMNTLLRMYSAANSAFPMRPKAGRPTSDSIDQPCLVIYGTAIPNHYYEALSERMLTNGFFARMIIVESGPRCPGQEPRVLPLPERVLETAKWWSDFHPGKGNLENWHPEPKTVEYTDDATNWLIESRKECERQYSLAESRGDPVGTTVWGRVNEHSRKLALLYAISRDYQSPIVDEAAAKWATEFVAHQTRRMLFMAQSHVADNPFHAECLKFLEKLRKADDQVLSHSVMLKRMKMDAKSFQHLVETLIQREDIEIVPVKTPGRRGNAYRLLRS